MRCSRIQTRTADVDPLIQEILNNVEYIVHTADSVPWNVYTASPGMWVDGRWDGFRRCSRLESWADRGGGGGVNGAMAPPIG